jgi:hypothetical protein
MYAVFLETLFDIPDGLHIPPAMLKIGPLHGNRFSIS